MTAKPYFMPIDPLFRRAIATIVRLKTRCPPGEEQVRTRHETTKSRFLRYAFLGVVFSLVTIAGPAAGQSIVVASFNASGGGGTSSASFVDVTSVSIELGFSGGVAGSLCDLARVGCMTIPLADVVPGAVFDFDTSNSMFFGDVVAGLTNGADEILWVVIRLFDSANVVLFGTGGGNFEAARLGISPDLIGAQIDFIRLKVNEFTLTEPRTG